MYYHASPFGGITQLKPHVSNHGIPLVYFSKKRENVLVYLSNAVEKYCKETGFLYEGIYQKWGPYGFNRDGRQRLEEYYPNALISTYQGVSGYIYRAETISEAGFAVPIPDAAASSVPVDERAQNLFRTPMRRSCRRNAKACFPSFGMKNCRRERRNGMKRPFEKSMRTLRSIRSTDIF